MVPGAVFDWSWLYYFIERFETICGVDIGFLFETS